MVRNLGAWFDFLMSINSHIKSVSMRKPGRTRQEVIQLKSPILLKLGINVGFGD